MPPSPQTQLVKQFHDTVHGVMPTVKEVSPATPTDLPAIRMFPIPAAWVERYTRKFTIPTTPSCYVISPLKNTFSHTALNAWIPSEHPEGALYFSQCHKLIKNVFTDAYLYDPTTLEQLTACLEQITELVRKANIDVSENELVLDLQRGDDGEILCGYYFVDHAARSLFWLEVFDISPLLSEVRGATMPSHIRHELESQYWQHWELYPIGRTLTSHLVMELKEILVHASGDSLTSQTSTAPYSTDDLARMLTLANNMIANDTRFGFGHSVCVFGRFMATFAHQRFLNFHGQRGARLDRNATIYGTKGRRSLFGEVLSLGLFCAPDVHFRALQDIWVDKTVGHVPWNRLIGRLTSEWRDFTLYGTLLLNANVTFLSVNHGDSMQSRGRIAAYISIAACIGAVMAGLLLLRQYRTKLRDSAEKAFKVLDTHGLETLAVTFALPYALIIWGGVSFLVALLFTCFQPTNVVNLSIMGLALLLIGMSVLMCIWTNWERWSQPHDVTLVNTHEDTTTKRWGFLNFGLKRSPENGSTV